MYRLYMNTDGTWSSRTTTSTADGYFCSYSAATLAPLRLVGAVNVTNTGCFPKVCGFNSAVLCSANAQCAWKTCQTTAGCIYNNL